MDGLQTNHLWRRLIPITGVALLAIGWVALSRSQQIEDGSERLVRQQIVWSLLGLAAMATVSGVDYRRFALSGGVLYAVVVAALAAVYFFPPVNGAHRWIRVAGVGIQPSEFAKVVFIIALAAFLRHREIGSGFMSAVPWPLAMTLAPMLLILKEPDLGTSLIFVPMLLAMLNAGGARQRDLVRLVASGVLLLPLLWSQMSHEQRSRMTALWEQNGPREPATTDGFHLDQAKRMFALGGFWGSWINNNSDSVPDDVVNARVPEPHTDSIFCVIGERFGLVGAAIVLALFGVLVAACLRVAEQTEDPFGRLIAAGVAALFGAEMLINTGMLVGLLPITGLSLPLVSYGGSQVTAHLIALGLVTSVARTV
jgi:cell division protein FtsW (lipid II flippase)